MVQSVEQHAERWLENGERPVSVDWRTAVGRGLGPAVAEHASPHRARAV